MDGKRTWQKELAQSNVQPTLPDVVAGDITAAMPYRAMINIINFIKAMDEVVPGFASYETLLYSPELKFYSNRVKMDTDFNTSVKGTPLSWRLQRLDPWPYDGLSNGRAHGPGHKRGINKSVVNGLRGQPVFACSIRSDRQVAYYVSAAQHAEQIRDDRAEDAHLLLFSVIKPQYTLASMAAISISSG